MKHFVYLLAAVSATCNAESVRDPSQTSSSSRPDPKPRGNPGLWATTNDYPSIALQKEIEGTTGFSLTVGPDGRVSDCVVTLSSGSSELDMATCTNVERRARFDPALDANGNPTTGKYANRIRWQIPVSVPEVSFPRGPIMQGSGWARILPADFPARALAEKRQGKVNIELAISPNGAVEGCKVLVSSTHRDLDAETCNIATSRAKFGPALDLTGQPSAGRVQTEIRWRIPGEGGAGLPSEMANNQMILPVELRPKPGVSTISFIIGTDGSLTGCTGQTTMETKFFAPDTACKAKVKMVPYTDANDQKVERRVVIKTIVEIEDVK